MLQCFALSFRKDEFYLKIVLRPSDQMAASIQFYPFLAKTSTSVHIAPIGWKLFLMVPINVSSHDLQENHFANIKLDYMTATNRHTKVVK